MNTFVNAVYGMKTTENGATAFDTTMSKVYDMFALGGAYRQRSEEDCVRLFDNAYSENPLLAMKCLFYMRDARGGQGERRFARVILKHLANTKPALVSNNIELIPEFGRWDDLYELVDTKCWSNAVAFIKRQLELDLDCKTPSLLAKWLKSENASSKETCKLGRITRESLGLTAREYRVILSHLRERINIVERLMSENRWNDIQFDKLPSKAGLIYKNAFARHDYLGRYAAFANSTTTKVNASVLYPYEVVNKALSARGTTDIAMCDKYWENLPDYTGGNDANTLVMADVSGSMYYGAGSVKPIDLSIALALYFADKQKGAFKNLFLTFDTNPEFVTVRGKNICEKAKGVYYAPWGGSTDLVKAFEMVLNVARKNHVPQSDMPKTLIVVSDMEINRACRSNNSLTEMQYVKEQFERAGYEMPHLIFWNVNARNDTILDRGEGVTCVSGCSPVIFESVLSGKTGYDLMLEKLNSERYSKVTAVEF